MRVCKNPKSKIQKMAYIDQTDFVESVLTIDFRQLVIL